MASKAEGRVASFKGRSPVVSRFSSRGPDIIDANKSLADVLKPDILAPGHQIWAAWSPFSAKQPMLTGTLSLLAFLQALLIYSFYCLYYN